MNQPTERTRKIYRATWIGMVVNIALSLLKLAAGILGRSGAMIADAVHSISDLATDVIVLIFARISSKPEDAGHNYGHGKYETLASILISLALIAVGGGILADSIRNIRLVLTGEIIGRPGAIALIAAAISIVAKEVLYRYTVRVGRQTDSPSVVANAWHHRSDALSSIGTLTGIGLAYFRATSGASPIRWQPSSFRSLSSRSRSTCCEAASENCSNMPFPPQPSRRY